MKELAKQINKEIINSEVYKRYLRSKENIENNENLLVLQEKMKEIKDCVCKDKNDEMIEQYYTLEKDYNNHHLVKEYEACKSELYNLLADIGDILSF